MKARKVKKLEPEGFLGDNAERIVRVRLDELCGFMPQAGDEREVQAAHDMRIAAKRLRYILEVTGGCFGDYARTAQKHAKALQDLLGEIHDCDEMLPRVGRHLDTILLSDADAVRSEAVGRKDLDPKLVGTAPQLDTYSGLAALRVYLQARRRLLFERFQDLWLQLEREGFRARLEFAIGERSDGLPEAPEPEPEPEPEPAPPADVAP